jgi:MFS family permease
MTIPVYAFASIMCVLNAWVSDRLGRRYHAVVIPYLIGIIGFIICITVDPEEKPGVIYLAMFFIATSLFPTTPSVVCWMSNNLSGQWKRAVGMALTFTGGNLIGGVVGSNIFLARESPNFHTAYYIMVAVFGAGIFVATFKLWLLIATNKKRGRLIESMPEERLAILDEDTKSLGDKSPFFRYTL